MGKSGSKSLKVLTSGEGGFLRLDPAGGSAPDTRYLLAFRPRHAFRCSTPSILNSLRSLVTSSDFLKTFKSRRLQTYFFIF